MNYQIQRIRRKVLRRIVPFRCKLGDSDYGNVYGDDGHYWVRRLDRADSNNIATLGVPFQVRAGSANIVPRAGRVVWVGQGFDGYLTVLGFDHDDLRRVGINPTSVQPNDPYREWIRLKQIQNFRALPIGTAASPSMKVQVRQLDYWTPDGQLVHFNGTNASTHIDLTAYSPALSFQRYVVLWIDIWTGDIFVTASTPIDSLNTALTFTDLQECANQAGADAEPIGAFRLKDAQTALKLNDTVDVDLRQFLNVPQAYGFPNTISRLYRIHDNRSVIMPSEVSVQAEGAVEIGDNAALVILDSDYCACEDGGGMTSFNITADSGGTTSVDQGETVDFDGADGITTTLAGLMLSFAVDNTVIRTTGTQAIAAGLTVTSPKINEILDTSGNEVLKFGSTASAEAELNITNGVPGTPPLISATGTAANISIDVLPKGIGAIRHYSASIHPLTDNAADLGTIAPLAYRNIFSYLSTLVERTAPSTPSSGFGAIYVKVSGGGQLFFVNDSGVHKQATESIAVLWDAKTTGTAGGSSSAATWNARDLNTEHYDPDGIVSISSNQFTPIAGDYVLLCTAPWAAAAATATTGRLRLFNVTGGASVQEGQGQVADINARAISNMICKFTANGTDAYRIDNYTSQARATTGLGNAVSDGSAEIYTVVYLTKVA